MLLSLFDARVGRGLEIGPSFSPLLPKRDGYNVETLDHMDAEALRRKYAGTAVDLSRIETVDYVGGLEQIHTQYDFIVASHVIEHVPDLLGFLQQCERLLSSSGILVLAVPDHRYAFDCLRPRSTTGQVIDALGRTAHTAGRMFDEIAYNCLNDGRLAWKRTARKHLRFYRPLVDAAVVARNPHAHHQGDIHAWQFSPAGFRLIMQDLAETRLLALREQAFIEAASEFFISLSRNGRCPIDRLTLASQA